MLTKQNIKSHKPLLLSSESLKMRFPGSSLSPPFQSKASSSLPKPQPLPSASPSSSHKPKPARRGAALGNSTSANYDFLEHRVGARLLHPLPPSTWLVSQPATASWHQKQHSSLQMPERENAGGSGETLQLLLLTLDIST